MYNPISALREAGFPVDQLNEAQQDVLAALTEQEATVLVTVQSRLRDAEDEVMAHEMKLL